MPGITTPLRERKSRRPTGLPNPPMMLLVGPEKSGKSFEAAAGTSSELIGMTYWIEIGGSEGTADYYGRVPGARSSNTTAPTRTSSTPSDGRSRSLP
ncbi:hypothetical protein ACIGW8_20455 [Streptomyces sioyaensis]|uniref:hypothetical protein n=1 Tax=Streptomyces sioyaensis TaxID=67364 RepID=UPI0037D148D4